MKAETSYPNQNTGEWLWVSLVHANWVPSLKLGWPSQAIERVPQDKGAGWVPWLSKVWPRVRGPCDNIWLAAAL
ncbi:hypothetical protein PanWU01x14_110890 [Parasponia andersonii]|uniref:Uncharacterized protein n=1 Tax=Parasponia andersonii TaxID=3476 RepID=A0A2P5CYV4_PARAD|nr:hypothetical protein PanWU01x14_110890 [Parasponia andersonii]